MNNDAPDSIAIMDMYAIMIDNFPFVETTIITIITE